MYTSIYLSIYLSLSLSLYIYIYIYIYTCGPRRALPRLHGPRAEGRLLTQWYTRSPLEDSRLFGPRPWKLLATTYEQMGS